MRADLTGSSGAVTPARTVVRADLTGSSGAVTPARTVVRADLTGSFGAVTPAGALQRWPSQQVHPLPLRISRVPTRRWMTSDRPGATVANVATARNSVGATNISAGLVRMAFSTA